VGRADGEVVVGPADTAGEFLCLESGQLRIADISLVLGGQRAGLAVRGGELTMERVKVARGEVALRVEGSARWRLEGCRLLGSGVAVEAAASTEGLILNCELEGCGVGLSVEEGAKVKVRGGSVGRSREQGVLLRGAGEQGVWRGEEAIREAAQRGVAIVDTELAGNVLGDLAVQEARPRSPGTRPAAFARFSTPRAASSPRPLS
jgi:hypothetical protein